jgi:hypothetical protein
MDVVSKRDLATSALLLTIVVSTILIFSKTLEGAAAWANIIALPVAIVGVILTLRGPGSARTDHAAQDSGTHAATQIGIAGRDQINVGRDFNGQKRDGR